MSPPLLYIPAYLGLFVAQLLAMTCNAFLDIQYQTFGTEVLIWAIGFGLSLSVGCIQRGRITGFGKTLQTVIALAGLLIFFVVLLRIWGFARAAVAFLAIMQIAYNCVTVTRRHLHLGLLASAAMVIFAASHHRANWSMLFYLLPYLLAVVGTLVAEQINRRVDDLKNDGLGHYVIGGQSTAIAAATAAILLLAWLLYAITPQITWHSLFWKHGQPVPAQGYKLKPGNANASSLDQGTGSGESGSQTHGETGSAFGLGWPSPADMREMAHTFGMPQWQSKAIQGLADITESAVITMRPVLQELQELWKKFKEWLDKNRHNIMRILFWLFVAILLCACWRFMRELKIGIRLRAQLDYLRFGIGGWHAKGKEGARQYYKAMERLLSLEDAQRPQAANTREYLSLLRVSHPYLRSETVRITLLFEDACYGPGRFPDQQLEQMRLAYREIYMKVFALGSVI